MVELCLFQISVLTNFDFLYDDEAEDVSWGPEYEDRRLSYCSLDVGSLDRDMKSNLQTLECLSGSEQDLTPHDSSDDEDEVLFNIGKDHSVFVKCTKDAYGRRKLVRQVEVIMGQNEQR